MVDFKLTEQQLALQRMARDFAEREIKPIAAEHDRIQDPTKAFPWEVIKKASKLGLRTMVLPEKYGGIGAGTLTQAIIGEELAAADLGVGVCFDQTWKFTYMLVELTNDEQRERYVPAFRDDDTYLLGFGITEHHSGSDGLLPYDAPDAGSFMSAVRDGDYWILNGVKHFISNGGLAKLYVIMARTDRTVGVSTGTTAFFVPADTPGFSIGKIEDKLGQRLVQNAELVHENVRIHDRDRLSEVNGGSALIRNLAFGSHIQAGATVLGPARAAYEDTLEYARNRVQGGKPIIEHQAVGMMLADMFMLLEASRNFIWKAAWCADSLPRDQFDPKLAYLAKVFTSEAAYKVCTLALEIWGGMGYMRDAPIEKYLRDAASFLHSDGTNQIHRIKSMRFL